jgi:hypothetical protein
VLQLSALSDEVAQGRRRAGFDYPWSIALTVRPLSITLLAGEPGVRSMVLVPDKADDEAQRAHGEREDLISEPRSTVSKIAAVAKTSADYLLDFFFGAFLPSLRASESPMAIACFRLFTVLPLRPLLRVPSLRSCIAFSTFFEAPFEYFLATVVYLPCCHRLPPSTHFASHGCASGWLRHGTRPHEKAPRDRARSNDELRLNNRCGIGAARRQWREEDGKRVTSSMLPLPVLSAA